MSNRRPLNDDERGVSTVLGAILVAALIIMVVITIRVNFVPQWDESEDAQHVGVLSDDFAEMRAALDRQLDNPTATSVTVPIQLDPNSGQTGFLDTARLSSELNFRGAQNGVLQMGATELVIRQDATGKLAALNEDWSAVSSNGTVSNVIDVDHLRLRLTDPASGNDGEGILLTITDSNNDFAGSLRYYVERIGSSYVTNTEVKNAVGTVIFDGGEAAHHNVDPPYSWANALDPNLFFDQVLAAAPTPYTLSMTQSGLIGDYAITYQEATAGGPVTVGGSGLRIPNYSTFVGGGSMDLQWKSIRLPGQTLVYEHGAIFRVQDEGSAVFLSPTVRFTSATASSVFEIDMPMLTGQANSRTGGSVPTAFLTESRISIDGQANDFTFTLQTDYPVLWTQIFNTAALEGGVSVSDYSITSNANSVTLSIEGPSTDPADLDVSLNIRQASIKTTFPS